MHSTVLRSRPADADADVAVLRWQGATAANDAETKERITVSVCRRHLEGLRKAGERGQDYKGWRYKLGWW